MIFVDTGAWIALTDRSDQHHMEAVGIYTALKQEHARLVTTDCVMDETATRLRCDAGHGTAVHFLEAIDRANKSGKEFKQIHVTPLQFQEALLMFRQYDSALLSLTDCVSFVVCKELEIDRAFAFDQHFSMMGISLCLPDGL